MYFIKFHKRSTKMQCTEDVNVFTNILNSYYYTEVAMS